MADDKTLFRCGCSDAALHRGAWEVADRLGWASTYQAEHVALTQLQDDAPVTLDEEFAAEVATATVDDLLHSS